MDRTELRAQLDGDLCSIARTVELIGDRWSMLVLREAFYGVSRFSDLLANLHISRAVLTERLDQLIAHDLMQRFPYQDPGQRTRHEYRLTQAGAELIPAFTALLQWGDKYRNNGVPPVILTHAGCGARVTTRLTCSRGHDVSPEQIDTEPGPGMTRPPSGVRRAGLSGFGGQSPWCAKQLLVRHGHLKCRNPHVRHLVVPQLADMCPPRCGPAKLSSVAGDRDREQPCAQPAVPSERAGRLQEHLGPGSRGARYPLTQHVGDSPGGYRLRREQITDLPKLTSELPRVIAIQRHRRQQQRGP